MEALLDSAVRLAAQHVDVASSVRELCGSCDEISSKLLTTGHSQPHAAMATEGLWKAVVGCCGDGPLLSVEERSQLRSVLETAGTLLDALLFLPHSFLQHVVKQLPAIPLEVLFSLHSSNLLSVEDLMQASSDTAQYVLAAIVEVSCVEGGAESQKEVMSAVAEVVCELVMRQCSVAMEMAEQMPKMLLAQKHPATFSLLRAAIESSSIQPAWVQELASIMLSYHLTHPASSLFDAVPLQSQWQYCTLPHSLTLLYSDLISALDSALFINLIQKAMSMEQLNWPSLLQVLVCFLHSDSSAPNRLEELVKEVVEEGMGDADEHLLSCGLLMARQASLEGSHLFPSYQSWLKMMFGDGSVVEGKRQLLFLLKVLTAFVPHDPVFALKAHIFQPPPQLAKCFSQVSDYSSLVSTRLKDMGEKVPSAGAGDVDEDASSDVAGAIAYYRAHGRVSQQVMEVSIIKQPYFVGRFLRSLLSPSSGCHGDRRGLIDALVKEKKIPHRMLKNYEKACLEVGDGMSSVPVSDEVEAVLRELPAVVKGAKSVKKLLSHLSHCLQNELSHCPSLSLRALQLVDVILSAVCEAVTVSDDAGYCWVKDMLVMLTGHNVLHQPLQLRLKELLTAQLQELSSCQLLGLAVLLGQLFCLSHAMASIVEDGRTLQTGRDYCLSLLSALRPHLSLRFGCLVVEQLMSLNQPVPDCLLHKMVYMYRRTKYSVETSHSVDGMLSVVDALLVDYDHFAAQWESCEVSLEEWLCWEVSLAPDEDGINRHCRQLYRWREVFGRYVLICSTEHVFLVLFKTLTHSHCSGLYAILQELCHRLLESGVNLLAVITRALPLKDNMSATAESVMMVLPPSCLFCGCKDVKIVADFIKQTLAPQLLLDTMILPAHITHYLLLGASTVAEAAVSQLCSMSPLFLASSLAHWQILPQTRDPFSANVIVTASWLQSGMQGSPPQSTECVLLGPLAVAVWYFATQSHHLTTHWLEHVPSQMVVLVTACCVHWLSIHLPHSQPAIDKLLQACIECQPSAVEAFCSDQSTGIPLAENEPRDLLSLTGLELQHTQLLADFRAEFSCKSSASYSVILLRLVRRLPMSLLHTLVATAGQCFLGLCVLAHTQCLSLCAPLPSLPPLICLPLSAEFIEDSTRAMQMVVETASCLQLKSVMRYCHNSLKPLIVAKLNAAPCMTVWN